MAEVGRLLRWVGIATILWNLPGPDVSAVAALTRAAAAASPDDQTTPLWLDAARANAAVRPWQPGFVASREIVDEVAAARRSAR